MTVQFHFQRENRSHVASAAAAVMTNILPWQPLSLAQRDDIHCISRSRWSGTHHTLPNTPIGQIWRPFSAFPFDISALMLGYELHSNTMTIKYNTKKKKKTIMWIGNRTQGRMGLRNYITSAYTVNISPIFLKQGLEWTKGRCPARKITGCPKIPENCDVNNICVLMRPYTYFRQIRSLLLSARRCII